MPFEGAKHIDSIMGARGSEAIRVSGITTQYAETLAEKQRLEKQLRANSYAATMAAVAHTGYINELVDLFNSSLSSEASSVLLSPILNPLYAVTKLSSGSYPFWCAGYFTASFADTISAAVDLVNPQTDRHSAGGLTNKFLSVNYGSPDEYSGYGPTGDMTLSPAFIRAVADYGQSGFLGSAVTQSRQQAFESSLGVWAIHAPFNGRVYSYTDDTNGTVVRIRYDAVNDPAFTEYGGHGWSTTTWSSWAYSAAAQSYISQYYSTLIDGKSMILGDSRDTGSYVTHKRTIGAVTVSRDTMDILIQPSFDPYSFIEDTDVENRFGFAVSDSHDLTYGWTACFAWNPYWKDGTGSWVNTYVDGPVPGTWPDVSGTSLFINSMPSEPDGTMGRDHFYRVNMGQHTLRNVTLSRAVQLQGVYSNMVKEIATSVSSFVTRYTALSNAVNAISQARDIYINGETAGSESTPILHNERFSTLLGSKASSVALKVPVDTDESAPTLGGIRFVLLTGKICEACMKNDRTSNNL